MIILFTLAGFDQHWPGQWRMMYPGIQDRDLAQYLQVANGIIPKNNYATWQIWQGASTIQYLDIDTPQQSFQEGETILQSGTGASGIILTDDGVTITFQDLGTGTWTTVLGNEFQGLSSLSNGQVNIYNPGAAVLLPNAAVTGAGALPQKIWVTDALGTDLGAIVSTVPNYNQAEFAEGGWSGGYYVGLAGIGGFLNPDYQGVGDYTDVPGATSIGTYLGEWNVGLPGVIAGDIVLYAGVFYTNVLGYNSPGDPVAWPSYWYVVNMGLWTGTLSPAYNNVVIWNGYQWANITGANGTSPGTDSNWVQLPKTAGSNYGYIEEWDIIEYDFTNNWLQYRADRLGNEFRYSQVTDEEYFGLGYTAILDFQWGNVQCYDNKINEGRINNVNWNPLGEVFSNTLSVHASIHDNILSYGARINANVLATEAEIYGNSLNGSDYISGNMLDSASSISGNTLNGSSEISNNNLNANCSITLNTLNTGTGMTYNLITAKSIVSNFLISGANFSQNIVAVNVSETYSSPVIGLTFTSLPYFDNDAAAAGGGLVTGNLYQLTGALVTPPFNVRGIVMVKQ